MTQKSRKPVRLIAFVGNSDLRAADIPEPRVKRDHREDPGPIWRFVAYQIREKKLGDGDSILLLDDKPLEVVDDERAGEAVSARELYRRWLQQQVGKQGADKLNVKRVPINGLDKGPTDLQALYKTTFKAIPQKDRVETHFLISPGTPAMYATLILASEYLDLHKPCVFESSREQEVIKVELPWQIGMRPRILRERAPSEKPKLDKPAYTGKENAELRRPSGLSDDTVVDDPVVRSVYAKLLKQSKKEGRYPILLFGGRGTGKMHAAREFARWRGDPEPLVVSAAGLSGTTEIDQGKTVIVTDVQSSTENWPELKALANANGRENLQFVFLWRVGESDKATVQDAIEAGLALGGAYKLPSLAERDDQIALVECFARQAGALVGKVRKRFQYRLLKDAPANNLHALRSWVERTVAASAERHVSNNAVKETTLAVKAIKAEDMLEKVLAMIANRSYIGSVSLDTMLLSVEALTIEIELGTGRTHESIAERLGGKSRSTVFWGDAPVRRGSALREVRAFLDDLERADRGHGCP